MLHFDWTILEDEQKTPIRTFYDLDAWSYFLMSMLSDLLLFYFFSMLVCLRVVICCTVSAIWCFFLHLPHNNIMWQIKDDRYAVFCAASIYCVINIKSYDDLTKFKMILTAWLRAYTIVLRCISRTRHQCYFICLTVLLVD